MNADAIQQSLNLAAQHQAAGGLAQAEGIYRQILSRDPSNGQALHRLGQLAEQFNRLPAAVDLLRRAIQASPEAANIHIDLARVLLKASQSVQAEPFARKAVQIQPEQSDAHNLLGAILRDQRQFEKALVSFDRAIELQPGFVVARYNRATTLKDLGRLDEAAAEYRKTIEIQPDMFMAHNNLATTLLEQNRIEEATEACRKAIEFKPDFVQSHCNLGTALQRAGKLEDALSAYDRAVELQPNYAISHNNRAALLLKLKRVEDSVAAASRAVQLNPDFAEGYDNLAAALIELKDWKRAIAAAQKSVDLNPNSADANFRVAMALVNSGDLERALPVCRRVIELKPDHAEAYFAIGTALLKQDKISEALVACLRAVDLKPEYTDALSNLGVIYESQDNSDLAVAAYRKAIEAQPEAPAAHLNLSLVLLRRGQFAQGWKEYEHRGIDKSPLDPKRHKQPKWCGEELTGKTILVYGEQGLGDCIHFVRYVPLLIQRGANVILHCLPELHRLFASNFGHLARVITDHLDLQGGEVNFDFHCPEASLPHGFGTELATIPADIPYLKAEPELIEKWKKRLESNSSNRQPRVGLVWGGNPAYVNDAQRSISLSLLSPLGQCPVEFHSLQKGPRAAEAKKPPDGFHIIDHSEQLTDFTETAALIANLDLVISVDTAVGHLAGAMGKLTWLMLQYMSDWRWLQNRQDSPWYPTVRLFRQLQRNDRSPVIQQLAAALGEWSATARSRS